MAEEVVTINAVMTRVVETPQRGKNDFIGDIIGACVVVVVVITHGFVVAVVVCGVEITSRSSY